MRQTFFESIQSFTVTVDDPVTNAMAQHFLLSCDCGHENRVREQQAGSELPCGGCGQNLAVPRLRALKQLPIVTDDSVAPPSARWGLARGLVFSCGLALALTGGAVAGCYGYWRSQLNIDKPVIDPSLNPDIQQLDLEQAWTLWEQIRGLEMSRRTPIYLENRRISAVFLRIIVAAGLIASIGVVAMIAALVAPAPRTAG